MPVNEIRYFIFENYYKQIGLSKENNYYSMKHLKRKNLLLLSNKLIEKNLILEIVKNIFKNVTHFQKIKSISQSFLRKKNRKSVKQSEITADQPNIFEHSNIVDIKPVITGHLKTSHESSKTIRKDETNKVNIF